MLEPKGYAAKLKLAREARGLTRDQLASEAGISPAAALDLEAYDAELTAATSVRDVIRLFQVLGLDPREFFGDVSLPAEELSRQPIGFPQLVDALRARQREQGLGLEQFERAIGWALGPALRDPEAVADLTLDGLSDLTDAAGVSWRELLAGEIYGR